jgi:hypothetical protein
VHKRSTEALGLELVSESPEPAALRQHRRGLWQSRGKRQDRKKGLSSKWRVRCQLEQNLVPPETESGQFRSNGMIYPIVAASLGDEVFLRRFDTGPFNKRRENRYEF